MPERRELPDHWLAAEAEANNFLVRMQALRRRFHADEQFAKYISITGGPETAAVKRASLDLTRQLAKMRRGES